MQNVLETVASQYGNSPNMLAIIESMNAAIDPNPWLNEFYTNCINPVTAALSTSNYGLDRIGRIVGVSRVIALPGSATYLGFQSSTGTASGVGFNQAPFYSGQITTSNYALTNASFWLLIQAKMLQNISNGSVQSYNSILMTLFGLGNGSSSTPPTQPAAYCTTPSAMTMTYTFSFVPNVVQLAIIQSGVVLQPPSGVSLTVVHP